MENDVAIGIFMIFYIGFVLVVAGLMIYSMWKVFEKAGEEGWKAIIPVYNSWTLFEIAGRPGWWALIGIAAIIPLVGILAGIASFVLYILAMIDLSKKFDAGDGFAVGLILLPVVFFPLLAFGSRYQYNDQRESLEDKIDNIGSDGDGVEKIDVKDW